MNHENKLIYMDYGATTPVNEDVYEAMKPYFCELYGNASAVYSFSTEVKMAIDNARENIAKAINCNKNEIFFTSGGTESDNWAIKGAALANSSKGNHIITSSIEHHAVLNTCNYLKNKGFSISYVPVDKYGIVSLEYIKNTINENTTLVSIMFANNEIGALQPIEEIGKLCREKNILFHTDAVQAAGHVPVDVKAMNIDLLSLSAHKFYGPKGVGVLYIRKGTKIENLLQGGKQERGRRAGTENTAGIVGTGKAIELCSLHLSEECNRLAFLRDKLIGEILKIPDTKLNGPKGDTNLRLPGNINVCFSNIESDILLMLLDSKGICASAGSACTAGAIEPSHVLTAISLSKEEANSSIRLSIGEKTTEEEIDYVTHTIKEIVKDIRKQNFK